MILLYHKVDTRALSTWWVDAATFYDQMMALKRRKVVYLDDYDPEAPDQVVITFDGVYQNVLCYAAPVLRRLGYPFELFLSSDWIGMGNKFDLGEPPAPFAGLDELKRLVQAGGRLQWHTRSHPRLDQSKSDRDWRTVEHELAVPDELRPLDPNGFRWFAYPYGVFSQDVYDETKRRFAGAVSCDQGDDADRHCLNRLTVTNSTKLRSRSICVVVVSHNYGAFLSEAVESVLQQTYPPDNVLIVDDASSDSTEQIGRRYASLNPELIAYLRNDERLGIVGTFNRAVRETKSDYVCFLGADNRFAANYLEEAVGVLERGDERLAIAYTDFLLFGSRAQEEYLRHHAKRRGRVIDGIYYEVCFPEFDSATFMEGNFIHGSAVYKRSAFERVGGYREQGSRPEDANLFRRILRSGFTAQKVPRTWLEYRQHSDEQANVISRTQGDLQFYRVYSKRLEMKVKALEGTFGLLRPIIRVLSVAENACFELAVRTARVWRRIF